MKKERSYLANLSQLSKPLIVAIGLATLTLGGSGCGMMYYDVSTRRFEVIDREELEMDIRFDRARRRERGRYR